MHKPMPTKFMISPSALCQSRRAFLRGVGVAITLPWLESLSGFAPASVHAASNEPPMRLASLFMPNGVNTAHWGASGGGNSGIKLSKTLEPLTPFSNRLFVPHGLTHRNSQGGDGHFAMTANFLSGARVNKTLGDDIAVGLSMDQAIAKAVGDQTPLNSLVLGTEPTDRSVSVNTGYTRLYGGHISWSDSHTPVAKEIYPRAVFKMLFGLRQTGTGPAPPQFGEDASVLDAVADDAKQVRQRVSAADRRQLEAYYESIRQIERRIEKNEKQALAEAWKPQKLSPNQFNAPPDGTPSDPGNHMRLMLDMIVLAFRMNATRVATFMFGNAVSQRNMSFLDGVSGTHHSISHHSNNAEKLRMYQQINQWHIEHVAYFLGKLSETEEHGGSLLDRTMVLFGSGISDGNRHRPDNLPIFVAGGGLKASTDNYRGKPLCSLHLLLMQRMGMNIRQFGDADRPLL